MLGLARSDRRFMQIVASLILLLLIIQWYQSAQWRPTPVLVERPVGAEYRFVLDINSATWVEWMQLDGIGETLARRIVEDRELRGPFKDVDDLRRVPGIGPKTLESIRPYGAHTVAEETPQPPPP